jgi:hypothetical protein
MAIAVISSGTQAATVSTEHTLATSTTGKTYVLVVSLGTPVTGTAFANGDEIELRIYTKVLSGSTETLAYLAAYANLQSAPVKYSVPVPANISCKATLKQTAGTGRSYDWALLSID